MFIIMKIAKITCYIASKCLTIPHSHVDYSIDFLFLSTCHAGSLNTYLFDLYRGHTPGANRKGVGWSFNMPTCLTQNRKTPQTPLQDQANGFLFNHCCSSSREHLSVLLPSVFKMLQGLLIVFLSPPIYSFPFRSFLKAKKAFRITVL